MSPARSLSTLLAVLSVLVLSACAAPATPAAQPASPTAVSPTASPAPASPAPTTASPTPTATTVDWVRTTVNDQDDCDALAAAHADLGDELRYAKTPMDDFGTMLITANIAGLLEQSAGSCWSGDWKTEHFGTFIGSTVDGEVVDGAAFESATFHTSTRGYYDVPYETERHGAGYVYFVDAECYGGRCAVCHYVEDDVMVSHSRPADGECRTTLYALVDAIRN